MEILASNTPRRRKLQSKTCVSGYASSRYSKSKKYAKTFRQMGQTKSLFDSKVQTAIQQHAVHDKDGHTLHPDLTPVVLTCVLLLGKVRSGRESDAHLFLTIIKFYSACHLILNHVCTAYTTKLSHIHLHINKKSCGDERVAKE